MAQRALSISKRLEGTMSICMYAFVYNVHIYFIRPPLVVPAPTLIALFLTFTSLT